MEQQQLFERYQDLQKYVGWTEEDARRITAVAALIETHIPGLIDDFYAEIVIGRFKRGHSGAE